MEFNKKDRVILRTKKHLKKNKVIFIYSEINWMFAKQSTEAANADRFTVFNRLALSAIQNSVFSNIRVLTNKSLFFAEHCLSSKRLSRQLLLNHFESIFLVFLALKLNNNILSPNQLKSLKSTKYRKCCLFFYQSGITHLRLYFRFQSFVSK